jgi:hypothetical protein
MEKVALSRRLGRLHQHPVGDARRKKKDEEKDRYGSS